MTSILDSQSQAIEKIAKENGLETLGQIPFDPLFTKSMVQGNTIIEFNGDSEGARSVKKIWKEVENALYR